MKNRYRIFHLIKSLGRGGAEMLLNENLRYADRDKFVYGYGYFLPWKDALVSSLKNHGGEVVCFDAKHFGGMLLSVRKLAHFLQKWEADLVHCHLPLAAVVGRLAARLAKKPVIYTEHNLMQRYNPWTRRVSLLTWNLQNRVIAVSPQVKTSIIEYAGNIVPVSVVENGISVSCFAPSAEDRARIRKEYAIPQNAPVVGTVTVFRIQKDLHTWMKAAQIIKQQHPDAHFVLVGAGPMLNEIKKFSEELALQNETHFAGLQEDVKPYYSAMDVYMNSSIFEGLPLALLEAMAMKLPVVVTGVGGIPGVVLDQKSGFIVAPKAPAELASRVSDLLTNLSTREQFGLTGRSIVEERFSVKRMAAELEALYSDVIENCSN